MSDPDFAERLERVRQAAEVIGGLPTETLQVDAFHYLLGQPAHRRHTPPDNPAPQEPQVEPSGAHPAPDGNGSASTEKKSGTRRGKPLTVNPDKGLDLAPAGKQSFADFVTEKKPASHIEKYVVCIYWILEIAGNTKATLAQVVTCYNAAKWKLPTDVRNTASQAGRKELENKDGFDNIKLSNLGRNLILSLPKADAK